MLLTAPAPRTLLLNASLEPLCVVAMPRAVTLVMTGKATVLESDGRVLHSEHTAVPLPVVLSLTRYVHVPMRRPLPPTRRIGSNGSLRCSAIMRADCPSCATADTLPK